MIVSLAQSYSISILDEIELISGVIAFPFGEFTVNLLNILNICQSVQLISFYGLFS